PCRMFRWRELQEMFSREPCMLLAASASNAASAGDPGALERLAGNHDWWQRFLDWEESSHRSPAPSTGAPTRSSPYRGPDRPGPRGYPYAPDEDRTDGPRSRPWGACSVDSAARPRCAARGRWD